MRSIFIVTLLMTAVAIPAVAGVILDESNVVLGSNPAMLLYVAGATPENGSTANCTLIGPGGTASWSAGLIAGQKYKLTSRRQIKGTCQLSYAVNIDSRLYALDLAWTSNMNEYDTFQEYTQLGYYMPTSETTSIGIHTGGEHYARIDYMRFDPTNDVYFDENSLVTFANSAERFTFNMNGSWPANPGTMPFSGPNGFLFYNETGPASVTGNVILDIGKRYKVYASRQVRANANFGYDILLNGEFFTRDNAITVDAAHEDFLEEAYLGNYTATSATTQVMLSNPGAWGSRSDYLRFEAIVPEPGSLCALLSGCFGIGILAVRRRG